MTILSPDERAFRADLSGQRFQAGVQDGRWRVLSVEWPAVTVAVSAAPRPGSPDEYVLRMAVDGYPSAGITAMAWDYEKGTALAEDQRPDGHVAGWVFRTDWNSGTALYAPWDRIAAVGHPDWSAQFPDQLWGSNSDITFYLDNVWRVLHDDDYLGSKAACAAALPPPTVA